MRCAACRQEHVPEPMEPMKWDAPIPAILHHLWLTDAAPTPLLAACRDSYLRRHPKWTAIIHRRPEAVFDHPEFAEIRGPLWSFYRLCGTLTTGPFVEAPWAAQADLLRLAALYLWGGFYVDFDMYCLKPLDRFRGDDLVLVNCHDSPRMVTEAVIGCHPHDIRIWSVLREFIQCEVLGGVVTPRLTCWSNMFGWPSYPADYFSPHPRQSSDLYRVTDNTHGIHCWKQHSYDPKKLESLA